MYVRVVRFTAVSAERIEGALSRIKESDGLLSASPLSDSRCFFYPSQGTAAVRTLLRYSGGHAGRRRGPQRDGRLRDTGSACLGGHAWK